jgi:hypothetical protein
MSPDHHCHHGKYGGSLNSTMNYQSVNSNNNGNGNNNNGLKRDEFPSSMSIRILPVDRIRSNLY